MSVFKSTRFFPTTVPDLEVVAIDLESHFLDQGFDVNRQPTLSGWQIDVSKGGMFKAVVGMRTAMKIEIEASAGGTQAKAGIGIWGQMTTPTALYLLTGLWPIVVFQLWGAVRSSKMDDEAMEVIARSLAAHSGTEQPASGTVGQTSGKFCTSCGHSMSAAAKFCPECGARIAA